MAATAPAGSADDSSVGRAQRQTAAPLNLRPVEAAALDPRDKRRDVSREPDALRRIRDLASAGATSDTRRISDESLSSPASGIRCWAPRSPATLPSDRDCGAASAQRLRALRSARDLRGLPAAGAPLSKVDTPWRTKALAVAIRGLTKSGDQSPNPGPAIAKNQLAEVARRTGWREEFAILAALSRVCFLRIVPG